MGKRVLVGLNVFVEDGEGWSGRRTRRGYSQPSEVGPSVMRASRFWSSAATVSRMRSSQDGLASLERLMVEGLVIVGG